MSLEDHCLELFFLIWAVLAVAALVTATRSSRPVESLRWIRSKSKRALHQQHRYHRPFFCFFSHKRTNHRGHGRCHGIPVRNKQCAHRSSELPRPPRQCHSKGCSGRIWISNRLVAARSVVGRYSVHGPAQWRQAVWFQSQSAFCLLRVFMLLYLIDSFVTRRETIKARDCFYKRYITTRSQAKKTPGRSKSSS